MSRFFLCYHGNKVFQSNMLRLRSQKLMLMQFSIASHDKDIYKYIYISTGLNNMFGHALVGVTV